MISDLKKVAAADSTYPTLLFFYQGTVVDGAEFFNSHWPEARAVSDLAKKFYLDFGLEQGTIGQILGPEVIACGLRAAMKGHLVGMPVGDVSMMPGLFLVK